MSSEMIKAIKELLQNLMELSVFAFVLIAVIIIVFVFLYALLINIFKLCIKKEK